jgi:hypothetical protein
MGRYVWYAEGTQHRPFLNELFKFIGSGGKAGKKIRPTKGGGGGQGWQADPRQRKKIEGAAIREVMRYYTDLHYKIRDRQDDKCGWDLEAKNNETVLHLEVKGVAGPGIAAELTANEYKWMKKNQDSYRVCIVTNALSMKPTLSIYAYVAGSKQWEHHEHGTPLHIEPVRAARLLG